MTSPFAKLAAEAAFGPDAGERLERGACPMCGNPDPKATIEDLMSEREFKLSGLCQDCQDKCFGDQK
jgi:hypothetical protein